MKWSAFGVLLVSVLALPVRADRLVQQTAAEFEGGTLENVSVVSSGRIIPGPRRLKFLEKPESFVWAMAADEKNVLYAGTGHNGMVYRIENGNVAVFFDAPDLEIQSLAVGPDGVVYAGTSPNGVIYRVAKAGEGNVYYDAPDPYIWALSADRQGNLYAGTGDQGRLLKITPTREAKVVYDSKDSHIMCFVRDDAGNLYAGTDKSGLVYKVTPDDKVSVFFDATQEEIHALAFDPDGNLYVGTADHQKGGGGGATVGGMVSSSDVIPPTGTPPISAPSNIPATTGATAPVTGLNPAISETVDKTATLTSGTGGNSGREVPVLTLQSPGTEVSGTNVVLRIDPMGNSTEIFRKANTMVLGMAWTSGRLYIATGNQGMLYAVNAEREQTLVAKMEEKQILSLLPDGKDGLWIGTGNGGFVHRFDLGAFVEKGVFVSTVFDAIFATKWGRISWRGETKTPREILLATRSGNVKDPDDTWSDWSADCNDPEGTDIQSPSSRFIQYRSTFAAVRKGEPPSLTRVSLAYLPANQPPVIMALSIPRVIKAGSNPDGSGGVVVSPIPASVGGGVGGSSGPAPGGEITPDLTGGIVNIVWTATDANGDPLEYDLFYRGRGETRWKELLKDSRNANFSWDTRTVPDGWYELRVTADDRPRNPIERHLTSEKLSLPFLVDNTPPTVENVREIPAGDGAVTVRATIRDSMTSLLDASSALDGREWVSVLAENGGMFDSREETVVITLQNLEKGEHTIVIQARDEASNVGAGKLVFFVR
ncbi:MAG: hypothetical protein V1809_11300 [Planctomycetota bacterium]